MCHSIYRTCDSPCSRVRLFSQLEQKSSIPVPPGCRRSNNETSNGIPYFVDHKHWPHSVHIMVKSEEARYLMEKWVPPLPCAHAPRCLARMAHAPTEAVPATGTNVRGLTLLSPAHNVCVTPGFNDFVAPSSRGFIPTCAATPLAWPTSSRRGTNRQPTGRPR